MRGLLLILITFVVYASSSVFTKLASMHAFLSPAYLMWLGAVMATLFVYAIMWQKVLEQWPLHKAYSLKSVTIVIVMAISWLIFGEEITINNIIGTTLIMSGIIVLSTDTKNIR